MPTTTATTTTDNVIPSQVDSNNNDAPQSTSSPTTPTTTSTRSAPTPTVAPPTPTQQQQQSSQSQPQPQAQQDLKLYENKLSEYDSIMHPNVIQLISTYISSGGDPSLVILKLSNGYKGYAQMCNMILSWMTYVYHHNTIYICVCISPRDDLL